MVSLLPNDLRARCAVIAILVLGATLGGCVVNPVPTPGPEGGSAATGGVDTKAKDAASAGMDSTMQPNLQDASAAADVGALPGEVTLGVDAAGE